MIDTIRGYIVLEQKRHSDFEHLFVNETKSIKKDGYTISLNLLNFIITIKFDNEDKPIKLYFNGSLSKFYLGNNLSQLDWDTTERAIQMLSDNLEINMYEATLTRIDYGINLILKHPIHQYISCLVDYPRLEKIQYKDSVTFSSKSGSKSFIFYDKLKELKKSLKTEFIRIPKEYHNQNILRYEMRLESLLKQNLKSGRVQVKDLFDNNVKKKLLHLWLEGYEKVNKLSIGIDPIYLLNEHNGLLRYLSYHGVERIGYDRIVNNIADLNFDVKNPSVKRSKMKAGLNNLLSEIIENTLDENLMGEIDEEIKFFSGIIH